MDIPDNFGVIINSTTQDLKMTNCELKTYFENLIKNDNQNISFIKDSFFSNKELTVTRISTSKDSWSAVPLDTNVSIVASL